MSIEKLTGQVMANQTAAAIYASLDNHVPPGILADNYLQSKLSGNVAECLALELFGRQLAMRYCHIPEVIDMLTAIEKHKKMRKPGTGGTKMFQEIADQVDADYLSGNYLALSGDLLEFRIVPYNLTIRCKNLPGAVALVSAKYRRGLPSRRVTA